MPSILRSRLALIAMLGAFLIPVGVSSLRGLTHVLTCDEQVQTPFSLVIAENEAPQILSSQVITRDGEGQGLCGGLTVDLSAHETLSGRVAIDVPITNNTRYAWRGTVLFKLGKTTIPLDIGGIPAGGTGSDTVEFTLDPGSYELSGSLLIGP